MIKNTLNSYRPSNSTPTPSRHPVSATTLRLAAILGSPSQRVFPAQALQCLARESQAEDTAFIREFVENSAAEPNCDLRLLTTQDVCKITASTAALLQELHGQADCDGRLAYRTLYACPEATFRLTTPGTCIADFGVQSASIHLPHAENWKLEHPDQASEKFILVIAEDVPKKNISTDFLLDHVVILPGTVLEVVEFEKRQDATYVLLQAAPHDLPATIYSSFDGKAIENFSRAKDFLSSLQ